GRGRCRGRARRRRRGGRRGRVRRRGVGRRRGRRVGRRRLRRRLGRRRRRRRRVLLLTLPGRDLLQVVYFLAQERHQAVVDGLRKVHEDAARPDDGPRGRLAVAVVYGR